MTELCVIDVPYDCGRFNARAGAGPTALLQGGLVAALESTGLRVDRQSVRLNDRFHHEWSALASIQRQVATMVRGAADRGVRALILSGNCGPAVLGAVGALGGDRTGVVWFDAHADLLTALPRKDERSHRNLLWATRLCAASIGGKAERHDAVGRIVPDLCLAEIGDAGRGAPIARDVLGLGPEGAIVLWHRGDHPQPHSRYPP